MLFQSLTSFKAWIWVNLLYTISSIERLQGKRYTYKRYSYNSCAVFRRYLTALCEEQTEIETVVWWWSIIVTGAVTGSWNEPKWTWESDQSDWGGNHSDRFCKLDPLIQWKDPTQKESFIHKTNIDSHIHDSKKKEKWYEFGMRWGWVNVDRLFFFSDHNML